VRYEGWEKSEYADIKKIIKFVVERTLPKNFNWNVKKIRFSPKGRTIFLDNAETSFALADLTDIPGADSFRTDGIITIYKEGAEQKTAALINSALLHEYAHSCDPFVEEGLNLAQRIDLLFLLALRSIEEPVSYPSYNVRIANKRESKNSREKKYNITRELWADLLRDYLEDPSDPFFAYWQAERNLCEQFLNIIDPDFDVEKAANIRKKIIQIGEIHQVGEAAFVIPNNS